MTGPWETVNFVSHDFNFRETKFTLFPWGPDNEAKFSTNIV